MHASLAQRQQSCSKWAFSSESHLSFTSTSFIIIPHPCSSQSQWGLMRPSRPSLPICSKRSRMYLRVFPFEHNYAVCCTSWNLDDCKGTYFKPICRTPKKKQDNTLLGPDFASGLPKKLPHLRQPGTLPQEGLAITAIRSNSYQLFCLLHM